MIYFENLPSTKTPLNAENLNKMQFDQTKTTIADCNDITLDSGVYWTEASTLNKPADFQGSAGFLIVLKKQWTENVHNNASFVQYWIGYRGEFATFERKRSGVTNNEFTEWVKVEEDSGWKDLPLTENFEAYSTEQKPIYRKIGKQVQICGAVKPKVEIASNARIAILPEGFRPKMGVNSVSQASGVNRCSINVQATGTMNVERYGTTTNTSIPVGTWLTFNITYFIA